MVRPRRWGCARLVMLSLLAIGMAGCGEHVRSGGRVDAARFQATIDNPYLPLVPGTRFRYQGTPEQGSETVLVEVTRRTKWILGVPTVVVRDTVTRRGQLVEDALDWYFGEDTKEYWHGLVVSTKGSWEAGKDGAAPGIVMKAHPRVGERYRQEHSPGVAEDIAQVLSVAERVTVPFGSFRHVLMTKEFTPLEPNVVEHKYYARGVGDVLEVEGKAGRARLELVEVVRP